MSGCSQAGLGQRSQAHARAGQRRAWCQGAQGTFRGYMTGFVLSVILTAIPFWLVMGDVLNDTLTTSIVIMALRGRADRRPHDLLPAHEHEVGRRLDLPGARLHAHSRRHHAGRLDMGHVSHGPEHDADVAARGAAKALTGRRSSRRWSPSTSSRSSSSPVSRALAVWQVHRRAWKLDLIARVEARVHAAPIPAPGPESWADALGRCGRVPARDGDGDWLEDRSAFVQAVTELGGGYWVMTPLARDDGTIGPRQPRLRSRRQARPCLLAARSSGPVTVTGLLRMSEPGGAFLRSNDPAADRWFSRDVAAIAASRGLARSRPTSSTRSARPATVGLPVAGLTVIAFPNNHLVYALTWGVLALMAAAGTAFFNVQVLQTQHRSREAGLSES